MILVPQRRDTARFLQRELKSVYKPKSAHNGLHRYCHHSNSRAFSLCIDDIRPAPDPKRDPTEISNQPGSAPASRHLFDGPTPVQVRNSAFQSEPLADGTV